MQASILVQVKQTAYGRPGEAGASAAGPVARDSGLGEGSATTEMARARGPHVLALMNRLETATINANQPQLQPQHGSQQQEKPPELLQALL